MTTPEEVGSGTGRMFLGHPVLTGTASKEIRGRPHRYFRDGGNALELDVERLREHYRTLFDEDIERIAIYESPDLRPEARAVLRREIAERGLPRELTVALDILVRGVSDEEVREMAKRLSAFPCPLCHVKSGLINAFTIRNVRGLLVFTLVSDKLVVACPGCISKVAKVAMGKNILLGLWSPRGLFETAVSAVLNGRALRRKGWIEPTQAFIDFVKPRYAAIKIRLKKATSLSDLLE